MRSCAFVVTAAHFCILQSIRVMYAQLCLCCDGCAFFILQSICVMYAQLCLCCGGCAFFILRSIRVMYTQFADGCHYRHCSDDFLYERNRILRVYLDPYGYPYEYLESGGGYLSRSSCRYLFLGVLPLSVSGVQPVLPCRSVPYQIEEFVPCPFVFQKYS